MFNYNFFLFKDLPSAWLCGVRIIKLDQKECKAKVRHNWFNSNPFNSLYWVVQGMASELTTGMLIIKQKDKSGFDISMLVTSNTSKFFKKARGKIVFECSDVKKLHEAFLGLTKDNPTTILNLNSKGFDSDGDLVSEFTYEWSLKRKF
jgi:hypothetical protein